MGLRRFVDIRHIVPAGTEIANLRVGGRYVVSLAQKDYLHSVHHIKFVCDMASRNLSRIHPRLPLEVLKHLVLAKKQANFPILPQEERALRGLAPLPLVYLSPGATVPKMTRLSELQYEVNVGRRGREYRALLPVLVVKNLIKHGLEQVCDLRFTDISKLMLDVGGIGPRRVVDLIMAKHLAGYTLCPAEQPYLPLPDSAFIQSHNKETTIPTPEKNSFMLMRQGAEGRLLCCSHTYPRSLSKKDLKDSLKGQTISPKHDRFVIVELIPRESLEVVETLEFTEITPEEV